MRSGRKFDIEVCTADGDRSTYRGATLTGAKADDAISEPRSSSAAGPSKNPMHAAHGTVNIRLKDGDTRKIYPILIETFNTKAMII